MSHAVRLICKTGAWAGLFRRNFICPPDPVHSARRRPSGRDRERRSARPCSGRTRKTCVRPPIQSASSLHGENPGSISRFCRNLRPRGNGGQDAASRARPRGALPASASGDSWNLRRDAGRLPLYSRIRTISRRGRIGSELGGLRTKKGAGLRRLLWRRGSTRWLSRESLFQSARRRPSRCG